MQLRFTTTEDRSAFIQHVKRAHPEFIPLFKSSASQPTVMLVRTEDVDVERRIEQLVSSRFRESVRIYEDVKFSLFAPAG